MLYSFYHFINLDYLEKMSAGDPETKKLLLEMLLKELQSVIPHMKILGEKKDWKALKELNHDMKSTLSFVGNKQMSIFNEEIERRLKHLEELETIPSLINLLIHLLPKVVTELTKEYAKL